MKSLINSTKVKDCFLEYTVILLTVYLKILRLHLLAFQLLHPPPPQLAQQKHHLHYPKTPQTYYLPVLILLTLQLIQPRQNILKLLVQHVHYQTHVLLLKLLQIHHRLLLVTALYLLIVLL